MGLRLEDVVVRKVVTIRPEASAKDAVDLMEDQSTSCLVMINGDKIEGIVTSRDVIQRVVAWGHDPMEVAVKEIASNPVVTLKPESLLGEAIKIMLNRRIKKIPLIDDEGRLLGLVSLSDVVEFHSELFSAIWEQVIMIEPTATVDPRIYAT